MSTFILKIGGEIVVLKTAFRTQSKLTVNTFIKVLESLLVLKRNIDKILINELINK